MFHSMPAPVKAPPLPSTAKDFGKTLDFHRALTAINSCPAVQRAMGLVFDIEIPAGFCRDSPAGSVFGSLQVSKVTPGFKFSLASPFASTFGWKREETTNVKSSIRFGNGLRVYLNRPWYSSGGGELLGAVLWSDPSPEPADYETVKSVWKTGFLSPAPAIYEFSKVAAFGTALALEESPKPWMWPASQSSSMHSAASGTAIFSSSTMAPTRPSSASGLRITSLILSRAWNCPA